MLGEREMLENGSSRLGVLARVSFGVIWSWVNGFVFFVSFRRVVIRGYDSDLGAVYVERGFVICALGLGDIVRFFFAVSSSIWFRYKVMGLGF